MEPHGEFQQKIVVAIIPARYDSVRLPGKMLREIGGKPLIVRTAERLRSARAIDEIMVATDDERIYEAVMFAGFNARMTDREHRSGTDRIAEVARSLPPDSIVVNVQGDEPLISPDTIDQAVAAMLNSDADIVSAYESIENVNDIEDPNVVKVVCNAQGRAMYFSRSVVPYPRDAVSRHGSVSAALAAEPRLIEMFKKHVGIYVFKRDYLIEFAAMLPSRIESIEMLEQMRALEAGAIIQLVAAATRSIAVDTQSDLEQVEGLFQFHGFGIDKGEITNG